MGKPPWIRLAVAAATAAALVVWALANDLLGGVVLVVIVVAIAAVPWRVLRLSWWWWLATLVGGLIGWIAAFVSTVATTCIDCNGPTRQAPRWAVILFGTVFMAILGSSQALALANWRERILWATSSGLAGFSFGLVSYLARNQGGEGLLALVLAIIVLGLGLFFIARSRPPKLGLRPK